MASSDVLIAKMALSYLGDRYDITSLSESSTEAQQINLVYNSVRDALLREHEWNFSKFYYTPSALAGTVPAEWDYMFSYPPTALRVFRILNPLDPRGDQLPLLPFDVAQNDTEAVVLLTNEAEPTFVCGRKITSPTKFDANFDIAFSWRLAHTVAWPITQSQAIVDRVAAGAVYHVALAKEVNSAEGYAMKRDMDPDWIRARK